MTTEKKRHQGLYRPQFEHDSCGIGFVANLKNRKSHEIVENALSMLERMEHRGGTGCDPCSGDGAGILIQVPHMFFTECCMEEGLRLPAYGDYGVGMVFFPRDKGLQKDTRHLLEHALEKVKLDLIGYRKVPVDNTELGEAPLNTEPEIEQVFIRRPKDMDLQTFERKLYIARKHTIHMVRDTVPHVGTGFYIISMSYKTIVYKGQLTTDQVKKYFPDLSDPRLESALAMLHSRFSTNTFPDWYLAQPFRYVAHNGEINTVRGNVNWMKAREALLETTAFDQEELDMLFPICNDDASDSANLDMVVELLVLSGRPLAQVMMMIIPEAWQHHDLMSKVKKEFYEYYACIMEPWDGPASISFTDGITVGATLDRNGLRPSRYLVTDDDMVVMASESGVLDVDPARVVERGRLQPGRMFLASLEEGRIISDEEVKNRVCSMKPYGNWLREFKIQLDDLPTPDEVIQYPSESNLRKTQMAFGVTKEDLKIILQPMVELAKEPVGAMGADTPLAVLSGEPQHFSHYFKQLFAQVTNPPIDPIRERAIMALKTYVGRSKNILDETPQHCHKLCIEQPVLNNEQLEKLKFVDHSHFQCRTIRTHFRATGKPGVLAKALRRICQYTEDAVEDGYSIIILSDRGMDSDHAPIPALLAVSAVHQHLIRRGIRDYCGLILESGDIRETHHFATVIGFGASAVNPYLTIDTLHDMKQHNHFKKEWSDAELVQRYIKAINAGLLKIFSKMGISTLQSYHGAQIFEILGINHEVVNKYFTGTVSRIEGIGLDEIGREALEKHQCAFPEKQDPFARLNVGGYYHWRSLAGAHAFNPDTIHLLQKSTRTNDYDVFREYAAAMDRSSEVTFNLRSLLDFKDRESISIDEVEPVEAITRRFVTGAMSFGAISWESHVTLAIAMNRLGGKSNSGEGGEDPSRFERDANGDWKRSATKQIASGRFGVTSHYLANADEIQIKMAQGAKPGEGGQLPGHKVNGWIGRTRSSTPGVELISPPPHHDIYSIEDLAQLIHDLKNANREARINVKLVSEAGVGTIAAGVCKGKADAVLIAGFDGGTGASPLSSTKHAGLPWELGLAETHQTLVRNKLRNRIVVQTDGGIRTPRDLAIATLLGAEEWGVATTALIVEGCIMMRKCHQNTCPVGIATQNESLRAKYDGRVEDVVNFFLFMARGLREYMAELGFRTIDEMVGHTECLKKRKKIRHWKHENLDLSPLLHKEEEGAEDGMFCTASQNHGIDIALDWKLMEAARPALEKGEKVRASFDIQNINRTTGTILSNEISKKYGGEGLPNGTIHIKLHGSAGQSFGAFLAKGIELELEGDSNDYFGKGLSGGNLVVYPDKTSTFDAAQNIVIGNVAFYGATKGESFIRGMAGERFCVRNSGARVVVEGIGDHGCEYMTGGLTIILGSTGRNFAAGMSGGMAFVYDENGDFESKCNSEMVDLLKVESPEDIVLLKGMVQKHGKKTGSDLVEKLLSDWGASLNKFVKVMPRDYAKMLGYFQAVRETGKYTDENKIVDVAFDNYLQDLAASK